MTELLLTRARAGDGEAFGELTDPYRRELQVHCYRILGSVQDAEDMLQETMLAAWRALDGFEGRASIRAWLYRIATNRCLNALRGSDRHIREPRKPEVALPEPTRRGEPLWLEPYPDILLDGLSDLVPGPDALYESKEAISLAFVTAVQSLSPRQRVVLLLRDVLGFHAAEVADTLGTTEDSVNGLLKRARATLATELPDRDNVPLPGSPRERELAERCAEAFERGDVDAIVALLSDDVWLTMPPLPLEYQGHVAVHNFLSTIAFRSARRYRLIPTRANSQPAFGCYLYDGHSSIGHAHGLLVLTLAGSQISAMTRFLDNSVLPHFGLPRSLRQ